MQFKQRHLRLKTTFDFADDELTYTFEDSKKKVGASIAYQRIPDRVMYTEKHRQTPLYLSVFCIVSAMMAIAFYCFVSRDLYFFEDAPLLPIAIVCCGVGILFSKPIGVYTIAAGAPPIRILKDKQAAAIMEEIARRRKAQLKKKLAQVDFDKPYWEELAKFNFLREQDVITEQEYQYARQKIAAMREKASLQPVDSRRMN